MCGLGWIWVLNWGIEGCLRGWDIVVKAGSGVVI